MGRLIDEDFVKRRMHETMDYQDLYLPVHFEMCMRDAPTIAAPRWVRCEEEPPKEEYRTYLVYTDTGYMCSCRWTNNMYGLGESDRWGWSIADVPQFQKVTHWMPIEPPKEDA